MVLERTTEHMYPYNFHVVSRAFWNKYSIQTPTLSHVSRVDVLSRFVDQQTGNLHTARLLRCSQRSDAVPSWVTSILGRHAFVLEETVVNATTQTFEISSQNLSFVNLGTLKESCLYQAHGSYDTKYTSNTQVSAFVPFLAKKLEVLSIQSAVKKAKLGLQAMDGLCQDIFKGTFVFCEGFNEGLKLDQKNKCENDVGKREAEAQGSDSSSTTCNNNSTNEVKLTRSLTIK